MILVLNAGSSSLKAAVFGPDQAPALQVVITEIGGASELRTAGESRPCAAPDHAAATALVLAQLADRGITPDRLTAAAHRVVHGGAALTAPQRLTPAVLAGIRACVPLAPLHNPASLAAIRALLALAPALAQTVSFDTAFHATNPAVATAYALPKADRDHGLRRYGFHGLSYANLAARLPALSGEPLPPRLLALHLGNGASLCAIRGGTSVATTMGYSPLDGLTMGTRAGQIDGNAVLDLARRHGIEGASRILNRESGLLALGGASDMRALRASATPEAAFAVEHFCYRAVRHAGSMIAAMGGLDAVAFTGGIGENDAGVRARILLGMDWAGVSYDPAANKAHLSRLDKCDGGVSVWIVPAEEEAYIADEARRVLAATE